MRTVLWTGALLALLLALSSSGRREVSERSSVSRSRAGDFEIAIEWEGAGSLTPASRVWREAYRVANLGGVPSGPLYLRVRTPLGLASESLLAANLEPGEVLRGRLDLDLEAGLSELCIDVRAFDGRRTRPETDPANNRVCRRLDHRTRPHDSPHVTRSPEDAS